jgi:hypothetical protein
MARRRFNVFSLAFLDVMSCGFGAVILVYLIINHATEVKVQVINRDTLAEIRMLDYQVLVGEKDKAELIRELEERQRRLKETERQLAALSDEVERSIEGLADLDADTLAKVEDFNKLKSDVETQEQELKRLKAAQESNSGGNVRATLGDGDRQYLTGLKVGGKRILIAVDVSASMLDHSIVNVLRRRNMSTAKKLAAPKWKRAVATVEWLVAQLPLDAQFQILTYNTTADSLITPGSIAWQEISGPQALNKAIDRLRVIVPQDGTSLENLFAKMAQLHPVPDNLYLIADGLPPQGSKPPRAATVTGRRRLALFGDAVKKLPNGITTNIIMFPMEGDPLASAAFWNLAMVRGGAYLSPSRDWP